MFTPEEQSNLLLFKDKLERFAVLRVLHDSQFELCGNLLGFRDEQHVSLLSRKNIGTRSN